MNDEIRVAALARWVDRPVTAYNLEVDGIHTNSAGSTPVLVHNSCGNHVTDILKQKLGSIHRAPLPRGTPPLSEITDMTMDEVRTATQARKPVYQALWKLLNENRFNKS